VVIVVMAREVETGREIWARTAGSDAVGGTTREAQAASTPLAQASAP
jgi:hypothetical protein